MGGVLVQYMRSVRRLFLFTRVEIARLFRGQISCK
jgi:hypothetical protein